MLEEIIQEVQEQMEKAMEALGRNLTGIRTGRASVAMLDGLRVDYYGNSTPLNQLATLSVPEPRLITIKPWEQNLIPIIEKAILSDPSLGLNPNSDSTLIRLAIPDLTEERRREITKVARQRGEEGRIAVRQARRDGNELLNEAKKDGEISEDEVRNGQIDIQELTDAYVKKIDALLETKEAEIMEV
ncbi:MAG: ribosome recycling factor [Candidatus Latescibacteria bacterium]|nr:ribosome recycling factor [Candidatus Latescibacterota bacterium]